MAKDSTSPAAPPAATSPQDAADKPPEAQGPAPAPAAAAPAAPAAAEAAPDGPHGPEVRAYLRLRTSDGYGPRGGFSDLTETEAKAGVTSGVLRLATADEIARRRG